ncbi:hypothetical protein HN858_04315 [Candidatus Falkowbacteria bacterium]|jgi:hypothetical protein|nr:hypothetical protein [Candidatus Falkowbacteria bacterium]MBT5502843.1 hypothetical protein [Candidatus Falkowbacteria bacterium]MBT6573562.1 hypothetical protein [Candidatus Falkowbacteria bacterium]MBT7348870.1 hypothetical protein [Candidatus Falkowbacteria bacterium]MBT7501021.1 hypothetical protein [Candidatus Falkowbacteria bacterium]
MSEIDKQKIAQMQAAYDEFVLQMRDLEKQGNHLVNQAFKKVDHEDIQQVLDEVKKISE